MRVGGAVVTGSGVGIPPCVTKLFLRGRAAPSIIRCSSTSGHVSFIKDVAVTEPPQNLQCLLKILKTRGTVTALLRWPTSPPGMEMQVVEVRNYGVWLIAKTVDQYIHRILAEEDANSHENNSKLYDASSEAGKKLYTRGVFAESQISNLDVYLLKKVGLFPDILERKVRQHFEKGDQVSALVTGEFYTKKEHFPGFGRPFVFNAEEVAEIAEWDDEQIEYIKEKVSEEGKQEDLKKGKERAQVALDEAAFLLDLASVEGTWSEFQERIAECYKEAGLHDIGKFILYKG
ncbi:hypothetical protein GIB67_016283 [Kingdonia uniflora]|uniref:Uncharacterized protein n=1 Tax=Kingdonia uniflora TaxID=39325 RepID=A0A7J7M9A4_9MAGN|nr:hypothetical protein GIB67_016283 [Kingdonia uniflora]